MCFLVNADELPVLDNETFDSVKPGLSAYADTPETVSDVFQLNPLHGNIECAVNRDM